MKIAVYAISKNEEQFIESFCKSAKDADLILIADTGSTDKTIEKAKEYGAIVHNIYISPWRFDKARDSALCLLPSDIDVCISLDLDETLEDGWRSEIERIWKPETTRMKYLFDWSDGVVFHSDKIHSRKGYYWHHPCHETLRADPRLEEHWVSTDKLLISHHPDPSKSRGQYLDILRVASIEDPHCPRNAFYYARELAFKGKHPEAIVALQKYLAMPEATWNVDRSYAYRTLGKSYDEVGLDGTEFYLKSQKEMPNTREPLFSLALSYYNKKMWQECFDISQQVVAIKDKTLAYTVNPDAYGPQPHDILAISAYHLGLYQEARLHGKLALDLDPNNTRLIQNLQFYNIR